MAHDYDGFAFESEDGSSLKFYRHKGVVLRYEMSKMLIEQAFEELHCPIRLLHVCTGDQPFPHAQIGDRPVLSYSSTGSMEQCCPDFIFQGWREMGIWDYDKDCAPFSSIDAPALINQCGWVGAATCDTRRRLCEMAVSSPWIDACLIHWDRGDGQQFKPVGGIPFHEHFTRWRWLLDVEGAGYSGRLKMLLSGNRVVFVADRPYKEWFFPLMIPFVHYVPINRDLSDLEEKIAFIAERPELETKIISCMKDFWKRCLSRRAAIDRWKELIVLYG